MLRMLQKPARLIPVLILLIPFTLHAQPGTSGWPRLEGGGAYVLFLENGATLVNGSARDYDRGTALRQSPQEQLFWFQRGGKEYVVRDAATLKQLQAVFEPQMSLGQQQSALEQKQAQLAVQLTGIIAQQEVQGEKQAQLGLSLSQLAAEQVRLQEQGESTDAVEAEMQGLEEEQAQLEEPQAQLAIQRDGVQEQQETLTHQREDLGRKLEKAAQDGERLLKALVDQALAKGTAKEMGPPPPVPHRR
jgi:bla regulator protein blaR1